MQERNKFHSGSAVLFFIWFRFDKSNKVSCAVIIGLDCRKDLDLGNSLCSKFSYRHISFY